MYFYETKGWRKNSPPPIPLFYVITIIRTAGEHCAKNMNQFPNSVKEISNFFARAARPVSTGNFFRVFCPPLADYGRFPYVSSFHIRETTHLHVGEYACRTRSRRAEVRERVYLFVNDQAWNDGTRIESVLLLLISLSLLV